MDLVEDSKKARKVDIHVVREYSQGKDPPAGSTECTSLGVYAEINARYVETSAKTGYNIGESSGLSFQCLGWICGYRDNVHDNC